MQLREKKVSLVERAGTQDQRKKNEIRDKEDQRLRQK